MKKSLVFIAVVAMISVFGYVKADLGDYATLGFNSASNVAMWRVDSDGHFKPGIASSYNIGSAALPVATIYAGSITGATIANAASIAATAISAGTVSATGGMTSVGGITVSTSATSTHACQLAGAVAALPTAGYTECDQVYLLSDHKQYVATATVNDTADWVAFN